jgi:hypothetical protein
MLDAGNGRADRVRESNKQTEGSRGIKRAGGCMGFVLEPRWGKPTMRSRSNTGKLENRSMAMNRSAAFHPTSFCSNMRPMSRVAGTNCGCNCGACSQSKFSRTVPPSIINNRHPFPAHALLLCLPCTFPVPSFCFPRASPISAWSRRLTHRRLCLASHRAVWTVRSDTRTPHQALAPCCVR